MKYLLSNNLGILLTLLGLFLPSATLAQTEEFVITAEEHFYTGIVTEILAERQEQLGLDNTQPFFQTLHVEILKGPHQGQTVEVDYGVLQQDRRLSVGEKIVLINTDPNDISQSFVFDRYRIPNLIWLGVIFAILSVVFARWRGLTSLAGLVVSIAILTMFVIPRILAGGNPLVISMIGATIIATISIYLAHGFSRRTSVAVISTLITTALAVILAVLSVKFLNLTGTGSEEAYFLQTAPINNINLEGLLLGAIIIGALGVLDDITTSQAAAIDEIHRANPSLSVTELMKRGFSVGREHITSLINTLALAYVGASLPALLLFIIYNRPFWVVANTEAIAEEIVRTLVGSTALMCAVPITTYLAAKMLTKKSGTESTTSPVHL